MVRTSSDGQLGPALERVATPDPVNQALTRQRLLAKMFDREVPPPRFGRFELREQIGRGGMGVVYQAWDPQLERIVAIKVVDTSGLGERMRERALREAKALARLSHPNVVPIFDSGLVGERVWMAMEFVTGATLREWAARAPRPDPVGVLRQWIDVGRGLVAVHAAGLVHRDVKPDNVLIGEDGRARLIDFGLVSDPNWPGLTVPSQTSTSALDPSRPLARFVGTYAYAAPEQRAGQQAGPAADQYALCVSIWESLCGELPPEPEERHGRLHAPTGAKLSDRLLRVLSRGMAVSAEARYPKIEQLIDELEAVLAARSRRLRLALGAGGLTALLGLAALTKIVGAGTQADVDPCATDPAALEETWGPARRESLRARFAGADEASASFAIRVEAELDEWAERWQLARRTACEAAPIEAHQVDAGLRDACLQHELEALDATLRVLLDIEVDHAAHGPELLAVLPRLESCTDLGRLRAVDPLPSALAEREAAIAGYDRLARARALAAFGELERADAELGSTASTYTPLNLEAQAFRAQLDTRRGRIGELSTLVSIAREAQAHNLDELAASLLVEAAELAVGRWSKPDLERSLVEEASAAQRRLGREHDPLAISLRSTRARLAREDGQLDAALDGFSEARALALALGDEDRASEQQYEIGTLLGQRGDFKAAREALVEGRDAAQARWGPRSLVVARFDLAIAIAALELGAYAEANEHLDRAEAGFRESLSAESSYAAQVRLARAKLLMLEPEPAP